MLAVENSDLRTECFDSSEPIWRSLEDDISLEEALSKHSDPDLRAITHEKIICVILLAGEEGTRTSP